VCFFLRIRKRILVEVLKGVKHFVPGEVEVNKKNNNFIFSWIFIFITFIINRKSIMGTKKSTSKREVQQPTPVPAPKPSAKTNGAPSDPNLKEFLSIKWDKDDFLSMVENDLDCALIRGSATKKGEWDIRVAYSAPKVSHKQGKNNWPSSWTISFGKYFRVNRACYSKLTVGTGTPMGTKVCLAMFDTDHPHYKDSEFNLTLKTNSSKTIMQNLSSSSMGKMITDFFECKLPIKVGDHKNFYFRLHKLEIAGLGGANFALEAMTEDEAMPSQNSKN